jgi:hypothetical protein
MRILLHPQERRPDPPPLQTDDRKAILVGIGVWCVLGLVALVFRDDLVDSGRGWWLWCIACGIGLGLLGLAYLHHRQTRMSR